MIRKIPLNPPLKKGEFRLPPLERRVGVDFLNFTLSFYILIFQF